MYSKEEFNKVWKDSDRESILNQFYYEHKELQEVLSVLGEVREYINWRIKEHQDMYIYQMEELLEILDKVSDE